MASKTRKLSERHKIVLAQCFGQYLTATEAAAVLKERFGIDMTAQGAARYDPDRAEAFDLSEKLREKLTAAKAAARKEFEEGVDAIPEAKLAVRVRDLAVMARHYKAIGNYPAMAAAYAQIAKEMGGAYTNRRELTGKDGKPVQFEDVTQIPTDQLKDEIRVLLGQKPAAAPTEPEPSPNQPPRR
jgi:hypothetical protein